MTGTDIPVNSSASIKPYELFSRRTYRHCELDREVEKQIINYRCIGRFSVKRKRGKPLFKPELP